MNGIRIERVAVERVIDLRYHVLRQGLPCDAALFEGDGELATVHLAALDGPRVVGCASLMKRAWEGELAMQLRGMAVEPKFHRLGIGRLLLEECDRASKEKSIQLLWANAREPAVGFYRRMGWDVVSERFEIPTAGPHFKIIRRLAAGC